MENKKQINPFLSIIVPVFNEENSIPPFLTKLKKVLQNSSLNFEIIFINDGSQDQTLFCLIDYAKSDDRIKILSLSRNFGKEAALSAGIDHSKGDVLIPIDVDLQDPPELIPTFIDHWKQGYDIVYGVRSSRKNDTFSKRASATWFYRIFNKLSPQKIPADAGDFRLIDRRVAEVLKQLPERNRFMKGLFCSVGFRSIVIPYERPYRIKGTSKWTHWKLWNFALDGLLSFSTIPLRIWTYIGAFIAFLSFIYGSYIVVRTLLFGIDLPGYASMLTIILFLGGIQLLSVGILGEYIGRIFIEAKNRPLYIVENIYPPN